MHGVVGAEEVSEGEVGFGGGSGAVDDEEGWAGAEGGEGEISGGSFDCFLFWRWSWHFEGVAC